MESVEGRLTRVEYHVGAATDGLAAAVEQLVRDFREGLTPHAKAVLLHAEQHSLGGGAEGCEVLAGTLPRMEAVAAQLERVEALGEVLEGTVCSAAVPVGHDEQVRQVAAWDGQVDALLQQWSVHTKQTSARLLQCDAVVAAAESAKRGAVL